MFFKKDTHKKEREREMENVEFSLHRIDPELEEITLLGSFCLKIKVKTKKVVIRRGDSKDKKKYVAEVKIDEDSHNEALGRIRGLISGETDILSFCKYRDQTFVVSCVSYLEEEDDTADIDEFFYQVVDGFTRKLEY